MFASYFSTLIASEYQPDVKKYICFLFLMGGQHQPLLHRLLEVIKKVIFFAPGTELGFTHRLKETLTVPMSLAIHL